MPSLTLATKLTLARILLGFLAVVCLYGQYWVFSLVALLAFVLGTVTDWLDGHVARSRGEVSALGMFLDPLVDKVFVLSLLIALVEFQLFPAWIVILILFRELGVTAVREYAAGKGVDVPAIRSGKIKSVLQFAAIFLALLSVVAMRFSSQVQGIEVVDGTQNTPALVVGITAFLLSAWVLLVSVLVGYYGMVQLVRRAMVMIKKREAGAATSSPARSSHPG